MKRALLCALVLTGCAHTTLYSPSGKRIFSTQADATNLTYTGNGVTFHADTLRHSDPTLAQGAAARNVINGVTAGVTAAGAAVATSGIVR